MAPDKKTVFKKEKTAEYCEECWGAHPNHKTYCSYSVGSRWAQANIVAPDYQNDKDVKTNVNGGYSGISRHVANIWGTEKPKETESKDKVAGDKTEAKTTEDPDWVKVEGDWVEI